MLDFGEKKKGIYGACLHYIFILGLRTISPNLTIKETKMKKQYEKCKPFSTTPIKLLKKQGKFL